MAMHTSFTRVEITKKRKYKETRFVSKTSKLRGRYDKLTFMKNKTINGYSKFLLSFFG